MPYASGISSDPTAINEGTAAVIDVFARASDGHLYQWRQSNWGGWGAHEYGGATIQGDPAAQSWPVGGFNVYWRGSDNNLWSAYNGPNYPSVVVIGGGVFVGGDPAPILNPAGSWENVFFRGSNGTLHTASCCSPGWTNGDLGGSVNSNLAIGASTWNGNIEAWFVGSNNHLEQIGCCSSGWTAAWDSSLNTGGNSAPAAAPYNSTFQDVVVRDPDYDSVVTEDQCCAPNWNPAVDIYGPRW